MCSCAGEEITIDTPVDEGFTPAEVVVIAEGGETSAPWLALEGGPPGTFTYAATYEGGPVFDEVGGCCGIFLCGPCPEGATATIRLTISSADGILNESIVTTINGDASNGIPRATIWASIDIEDVQGTAPNQPFLLDGKPIALSTISIALSWPGFDNDVAEPFLRIVGHNDRDGVVLVETQPP